jgi:hypothetical protein
MTEHCDRHCGEKFRSTPEPLRYQGFNLKLEHHAHAAGHAALNEWGFDVG